MIMLDNALYCASYNETFSPEFPKTKQDAGNVLTELCVTHSVVVCRIDKNELNKKRKMDGLVDVVTFK